MAEVTTQQQIVREAPEVEAYKLGLLQLAKDVSSQPISLPAMQVAGLAPEQAQAVQLAQQGIGSYAPYLQQAGQLYSGVPGYAQGALQSVTQGAGLATALGMQGAQAYDPNMGVSFMNPYQQAVTQEALREIGRQGQIQQQNLSSQAVRAGAFGGSREGVQRAEQNRNILDLMSKRIAEDYSQNFLQAQQASMNAFQNQQARAQQAGNLALGAAQSVGQTGIQAGGLQQQAGTSTAALGQQLSGLQQGDVSFLYNMGTNLQGQQQRVLDAARQTQLQQSYEPYQRISFLSDIYKGAPSSQQTLAQTTAPSPSMASQVGGLGIAALGAYNLFGKQGS
jgi:hypothetical protein